MKKYPENRWMRKSKRRKKIVKSSTESDDLK